MSTINTQAPPSDYLIKAHQFTKTVHRDQYPSIDPTSPKLSQKGKTVIITGASQGIGKAIAIAFARADASKIVIVSRTIAKFETAKQDLLKVNQNVDVLIVQLDTTSEKSVNSFEEVVKSKFGIPDVLVNNVGIWSCVDTIGDSKPKEWWYDFKVNIKGTYLMSRAFLRLVGLDREATIVNVGTWGMLTVRPVGSSYFISKLAQGRLSEAIAVAYPKVSSMNFHPGMIITDMSELHPEVVHFSKDTAKLASGTAVYLASPEAKFLSGRYMSSNWDVDYLKARETEIIEKNLLRINLTRDFGSEFFT